MQTCFFLTATAAVLFHQLRKRKKRQQVAKTRAFSVDEIYFGTLAVHFKKGAGALDLFELEEYALEPAILINNGKKYAPKAMSRFKPIQLKVFKERGVFKSGLALLPCLPKLDVVKVTKPKRKGEKRISNDNQRSHLPRKLQLLAEETFSKPLIKAKKECFGNVLKHMKKAYGSGVRSAVVKLSRCNQNDDSANDAAWYRLKGCGNYDEGFVAKEIKHMKYNKKQNKFAEVTFLQIRGSAFVHTAVCENYVGAKLAPQMRLFKVLPGNFPFGYWRYSGVEQLPFGHENVDMFQTACIIERTIGDRRLHTHLLSGLFLLFSSMIDTTCISIESASNLFPEQRPKEDGSNDSPVSTANFIEDSLLLASYRFVGADVSICEGKSNGFVWSEPRNRLSLANAKDFDFHEMVPRFPQKQWRTKPNASNEEEEVAMDERWKFKWNQISHRLRKKLKRIRQTGKKGSVLPYLFSRLGYDCGRFVSVLHNHSKTSWGTYQDSLCHEGQWHCNAHSNNMVVLDPRETASLENECHAFLGYVDLDMAFSRDEYVNLKEGGMVGIGEKAFDALLEYEHLNFKATLTGLSNSSGLRSPQILENEEKMWGKEKYKILKLLRTALYDTMVLSYQDAYEEIKQQAEASKEIDKRGKTACVPYDAELHDAARDFIELALICQSQYVA